MPSHLGSFLATLWLISGFLISSLPLSALLSALVERSSSLGFSEHVPGFSLDKQDLVETVCNIL